MGIKDDRPGNWERILTQSHCLFGQSHSYLNKTQVLTRSLPEVGTCEHTVLSHLEKVLEAEDGEPLTCARHGSYLTHLGRENSFIHGWPHSRSLSQDLRATPSELTSCD